MQDSTRELPRDKVKRKPGAKEGRDEGSASETTAVREGQSWVWVQGTEQGKASSPVFPQTIRTVLFSHIKKKSGDNYGLIKKTESDKNWNMLHNSSPQEHKQNFYRWKDVCPISAHGEEKKSNPSLP